jgi:hypothetical protein
MNFERNTEYTLYSSIRIFSQTVTFLWLKHIYVHFISCEMLQIVLHKKIASRCWYYILRFGQKT